MTDGGRSPRSLPGVLGRISGLPEEILYFARVSAYGIFIGLVYWFVSYEVMGTVLLLLFGVGTGAFALMMLRSRPHGRQTGIAGPGDAAPPDGPFGDEAGRIPSSGYAPFIVGFGVAMAGLGLVFGSWMILAGAIPLVAGAISWLRSAEREYRAVEADSQQPTAGH